MQGRILSNVQRFYQGPGIVIDSEESEHPDHQQGRGMVDCEKLPLLYSNEPLLVKSSIVLVVSTILLEKGAVVGVNGSMLSRDIDQVMVGRLVVLSKVPVRVQEVSMSIR